MTDRLSEIDNPTAVALLCDCPRVPDPACSAYAPSSGFCTRAKGHDGPHVACGGQKHQLKVWDDDGTERDVEPVRTGYSIIDGDQR